MLFAAVHESAVGRLRHASHARRCPQFGVDGKTFARSELYRFLTQSAHLQMHGVRRMRRYYVPSTESPSCRGHCGRSTGASGRSGRPAPSNPCSPSRASRRPAKCSALASEHVCLREIQPGPRPGLLGRRPRPDADRSRLSLGLADHPLMAGPGVRQVHPQEDVQTQEERKTT
jgi:hypothetical protein